MGFLHPMLPPIAQLCFPAQLFAQLSQLPGLLCDQRRPVDTKRPQRDLRRIVDQAHDNFLHIMSLFWESFHFTPGTAPQTCCPSGWAVVE